MLLFKFSSQVKIDININISSLYAHPYIPKMADRDSVSLVYVYCNNSLQHALCLLLLRLIIHISRYIPSHQADHLPCRDKMPPSISQISSTNDKRCLNHQGAACTSLVQSVQNSGQLKVTLHPKCNESQNHNKGCLYNHVMKFACPNSTLGNSNTVQTRMHQKLGGTHLNTRQTIPPTKESFIWQPRRLHLDRCFSS